MGIYRMAVSRFSTLQRWNMRTPWLLPALVLIGLAAASVLDRRESGATRTRSDDTASRLEAVGAIEPDPDNPVRSLVRIQWTSFLGAEAYEVRFWSQEMREVGRHRAGAANVAVLDLEETWRPVAPSRLLHWRVVAMANGADIAASDLGSLRLP